VVYGLGCISAKCVCVWTREGRLGELYGLWDGWTELCGTRALWGLLEIRRLRLRHELNCVDWERFMNWKNCSISERYVHWDRHVDLIMKWVDLVFGLNYVNSERCPDFVEGSKLGGLRKNTDWVSSTELWIGTGLWTKLSGLKAVIR